MAIDVDELVYELLFQGTEIYNNKPYWLASSGVFAYSRSNSVLREMPDEYAEFRTGNVCEGYVDFNTLFYSFDKSSSIGKGYGVRPVVSLKSNVTVDQIKVISGSRGEDWTPEWGY